MLCFLCSLKHVYRFAVTPNLDRYHSINLMIRSDTWGLMTEVGEAETTSRPLDILMETDPTSLSRVSPK